MEFFEGVKQKVAILSNMMARSKAVLHIGFQAPQN
jgi:hypothetical protein